MLLPILTAAVACVDPATYGAIPDDGQPDTAALQRAIDVAVDAGGKLCLPKGTFQVERTRELGSLMITRGPLEISGSGPQTVIRMTGDGARADWRAFEIRGARGVYFHDFTIDGLEAFNTREQTHLIEVAPGSADITIDHMTLGPMRRPDQAVGQGIGGDCIRLLGKPGAEVSDVLITNTRLFACDRSGVSLQRSLRRIVIAHSTIADTGDQEIDFEPTGKGTIEDVALLDLAIHRNPAAQGGWAIAIGGHGPYPARRVTLADCRIDGGGIRILDAVGVQILRNTIANGARKTPSIIVLRKAADIRIAHNRITRADPGAAAPVLAGSHLHGYAPRGVVFEHNDVHQAGAASVVNLHSVSGVVVRDNRVAYTAPAGSRHAPVVNVTAVLGDVAGVTVADNHVTGDTGAVLAINHGRHRLSFVDVRGNIAPLAARELECRGTPAAFAHVRVAGGARGCGAARPPVVPATRRP